MPDAVLFHLSPGEKRTYFQTEYIIGERYLNVIDPAPSFEMIQKSAKNAEHYFAFHGLYAMTGESDGMEILLANDGRIYRVDTTSAFPLSNYQLDRLGIAGNYNGYDLATLARTELLSAAFPPIDSLWDYEQHCICEKHPGSTPIFLEPFNHIQEIRDDYIDNFLNTLCYFYPDVIGDYFKRYLTDLKIKCAAYLKTKA